MNFDQCPYLGINISFVIGYVISLEACYTVYSEKSIASVMLFSLGHCKGK